MLIRVELVLAPPTTHHVIFCSCSLTLSLLLFPFTPICLRPTATHLCTKYAIIYIVISYLLYLSLPLSLFALYTLLAWVILSGYNFPLYLVFNSEEEEDGGAVVTY